MSQFDEPTSRWETRVGMLAQQIDYPATPAIARTVRARLDGAKTARTGFGRIRLAQAGLIALIALGALMAVPGVRAAVLDFIRVGAVRIFLAPATPTPTPAPLSDGLFPPGQVPVTSTPGRPAATPFGAATAPASATPSSMFSLDDLAGETTLADARARAGFLVMLPAYPPDLGPPDRVYMQDFGGYVVIMVWMDSKLPDHIRMSLHALGPGTNAFKIGAILRQELEINGQYAAWLEGPYMLAYRNGDSDMRRMVNGHILIWTAGDVTYRLESDLTLDEAVKVAESLR